MYEQLLVTLVCSLPKYERRARIKHNDIFEDYENKDATATDSGLLALCSNTTPREETITPILSKLVT